MSGEEAAHHYRRNTKVVFANLEGIDEQMALHRSDHGENSVNWILGHLLYNRSVLLRMIEGEVWEDVGRIEIYQGGGKTWSDVKALKLSQLLEMWELSGQSLDAALPEADTGADAGRFGTIAEALVGFCFHEAYHAGQIGILRRLLGLKGQIK